VCQLTSRDLTNQEPTIHELNDSVETIIGRSSGSSTPAPLVSKQREMNEMYSVVQVLARDQTYLLRDKYRQVSQRGICGIATSSGVVAHLELEGIIIIIINISLLASK